MSYLILSTYPGIGSRNSGDDLIAKSLADLIKTVKGKNSCVDIVSIVDKGLKDVPNFSKYKAILAPALRPTLKGNEVAPVKRKLFLDEAKIKSIPVFAIGAAWNTYPGTIKQSHNLKLDENDKKQLLEHFGPTNTAKNLGLISCRDITTENLLRNNGIECYGTTGDCALFDYHLLGTEPLLPKNLKKIAISMPHNRDHWNMACSLASKLKKEFTCEVFITFHGYHGNLNTLKNLILDVRWKHEQLNYIDLSGGAEKLKFYNDIDTHIGFRLHAHIWFLRNRKPSLLIAEDGRGLGHLATVNGLGYSAASKLTLKKADQMISISDDLVKQMRKIEPNYEAINLLKEEMGKGFPVTRSTLNTIDHLWEFKMKPCLELIP